MVFRGPMNIKHLAVYQPSSADATSWGRKSFWNPSTSNNLVWLNNDGGGQSGSFSICGGNSQSYVSADGTTGVASPQQFLGNVPNLMSVNALTSSQCNSYPGACGAFFRNVSLHGWKGDSQGAKAFVVEFTMPLYSGSETGFYSNIPAFWILNAKIVHCAQFGCNCRGTGPQGCGELDVAEVINGQNVDQAATTIYSFRGAIGGSNYFARPTTDPKVYIVIFNPDANGLDGTIQITTQNTFDFTQRSLSKATIASLNAKKGDTLSLANRVPSPNPYPCPN